LAHWGMLKGLKVSELLTFKIFDCYDL
jgi:hypothetical protein